MFDPAGSFRSGKRGSGDFFDGKDATLQEYLSFHEGNGSRVGVQTFSLSTTNATVLVDRVLAQNGAMPFRCTCAVSNIINGVGPFKDLGTYSTPGGLSGALND